MLGAEGWLYLSASSYNGSMAEGFDKSQVVVGEVEVRVASGGWAGIGRCSFGACI